MKKRYIFMLNPKAGQGKAFELEDEINKVGEKLGLNVEICKTKEELDAEFVARQLAQTATADRPVRIYACGGDGTLNEVLNGIVGYDHVELGVLPMGTGNDFIRNFGTAEEFLDIKAQLLGESEKTDIIKYNCVKDDYHSERYYINILNIGFDCNAAEAASHLKQLPLVSGSMAYILGVASMLVKMEGVELEAVFDDGQICKDKYLLVAIANGCFYGGGVKGVPEALTDDGLMDVSLIKKCSRTQLINLFPKYQKGTHLTTKAADKLVTYKKCKKIKLTALNNYMRFAADGEVSPANSLELEIVPKAVKFVVPAID